MVSQFYLFNTKTYVSHMMRIFSLFDIISDNMKQPDDVLSKTRVYK